MAKVIVDGERYVPMPEPVHDVALLAALEQRFDSDAGEQLTVRDYLYKLLETLWDEGEGFSSKRPFGNSGWEFDLYKPLIAGGFISGSLDEDGFVNDFDREAAPRYVFDLIKAMCYGVQ